MNNKQTYKEMPLLIILQLEFKYHIPSSASEVPVSILYHVPYSGIWGFIRTLVKNLVYYKGWPKSEVYKGM